jgi:hypothetical protein
LSACQDSSKAELELAVEKAVALERANFAKQSKSAEQLTNDLMNEMAELRSGLNKSQLKQTSLARQTSQGEARLKRELEQCRSALKKSEDSYEELLKTLAEAKEPVNNNKGNKGFAAAAAPGMSYEDRAVLGQACKEASRALAQVGDDVDETEAGAGGGGSAAAGGGGGNLSCSVMEIIGAEGSPSDAAMSVRKLSEALLKAHSSKIAIERFNVGEVAMFFPIPKKGDSKKQEYVAFSAKRNKEKHFLADESKELIGKSQHFKE